MAQEIPPRNLAERFREDHPDIGTESSRFDASERQKTRVASREAEFLDRKKEIRDQWSKDDTSVFSIRAHNHDVLTTAFLKPSSNDPLLEWGGHMKLSQGMEFTVDLGGNSAWEMGVGAGHILPPYVTKIEVTKFDSSSGALLPETARIGTRSHRGDKIGYFDSSNDYLEIFSGYRIKILEMGRPEDFKKEYEEEKAIKDRDVENEKKLFEEMESLRKEYHLEKSPETKQDFMRIATVLAKRVEEAYGIPWQVTVAQASLESNFGQSGSARNGGNFFGIKKWWGHGGTSSEWSTKEVYGGAERTERASFCNYNSMVDSFFGYGRFLSMNDRYSGAFQYKDNPQKFLEEIRRAGYATDPDYVRKAVAVVKPYGVSFS